MKLRLRGRAAVTDLAGSLSQSLADDPLFCLYCPDPAHRQRFAFAYFSYYLTRWAGGGRAYISDDRSAVAILTPKSKMERVPHGSGAWRLRFTVPGAFENMCAHHCEIAELMQVVLPADLPVCNLRLFAPSHSRAAGAVLQEAVGYARLKNLPLTYETVSDSDCFVDKLLQSGFRVGYRGPVAGGHMQTVLFADFSQTPQP